MSDLTEFLLARIAEDESAAHVALGEGGGRWASWNRSWDASPARDLAIDGKRVAALPTTIDEHVTRWDPRRVLAECEAKRRIVEEVQSVRKQGYAAPGTARLALNYSLDRVLRLLALPYADHPDYRQEWRP